MSRRQRRGRRIAESVLKPRALYPIRKKSRIGAALFTGRHRTNQSLFKSTQKHFLEVQEQFGIEEAQKGFSNHFICNPIGTMICIILIFLTIFYLGSGVGPITNASIANDFTVLYNNTAGWLGPTIVFAIFIPSLALAALQPRPDKCVNPVELERRILIERGEA